MDAGSDAAGPRQSAPEAPTVAPAVARDGHNTTAAAAAASAAKEEAPRSCVSFLAHQQERDQLINCVSGVVKHNWRRREPHG